MDIDPDVLVVDFGAQYAQLIAVVCAKRTSIPRLSRAPSPPTRSARKRGRDHPLRRTEVGLRSSGAVTRSPDLRTRHPVLGICYGAQLMALQLGGEVANTGVGEYGRTTMTRQGTSVLMEEWPASVTCWMTTATRSRRPRRVRRDRLVTRGTRRGHGGRRTAPARGAVPPEVAHTERGQDLLANFLHHVAVSADVDEHVDIEDQSQRFARKSAPRRCSARSRAASTRGRGRARHQGRRSTTRACSSTPDHA